MKAKTINESLRDKLKAPTKDDIINNIKNTSLYEKQKILFNSVTSGDIKMVSKLLEFINPNFQSISGYTPLIYACIKDEFEIVNLLLDCGADQTIPTDNGYYLTDFNLKTRIVQLLNIYKSK